MEMLTQIFKKIIGVDILCMPIGTITSNKFLPRRRYASMVSAIVLCLCEIAP